jgi:hypothetical protein
MVMSTASEQEPGTPGRRVVFLIFAVVAVVAVIALIGMLALARSNGPGDHPGPATTSPSPTRT